MNIIRQQLRPVLIHQDRSLKFQLMRIPNQKLVKLFRQASYLMIYFLFLMIFSIGP